MTPAELIAALESAPTGTRELGVAVLKAVGAFAGSCRYTIGNEYRAEYGWYYNEDLICNLNNEARVVTDLNFRLPGVPEGTWSIYGNDDDAGWWANIHVQKKANEHGTYYESHAHTEALARIIVQLKAVLAMKEKV